MDMSGMDHGGGSGDGGAACKISMLWNWNTVDACFISDTWHVRSKGGFAGSCIGVICLVILLEGLKFLQRKHDRSIVLSAAKRARRMKKEKALAEQEYEAEFQREASRENEKEIMPASSGSSSNCCNPGPAPVPIPAPLVPALVSTFIQSPSDILIDNDTKLRLTVLQQALRSLIHTAQFAVAYFVMLLAMYFNGYIIICIFLGAYIGSFIFSWDVIEGGGGDDAQETTGCCG